MFIVQIKRIINVVSTILLENSIIGTDSKMALGATTNTPINGEVYRAVLKSFFIGIVEAITAQIYCKYRLNAIRKYLKRTLFIVKRTNSI